MRVVGIIPVRFDSRRFPGKALAVWGGKTLLQHVFERSWGSAMLEELVIATDDKRIYDNVVAFGAPAVITPRVYCSGTDRVAHAVSSLDCDIVVNIQGDQPLVVPQVIDQLIERLMAQPKLAAVTPVYPLDETDDISNPNIVKVVIDSEGYALYFSRAPIPYVRNKGEEKQIIYKHIGIYAYRKEVLEKFAELKPGPLETAEGLEQLRLLEHGYRIMTVPTIYDSPSIDTEEDFKKLELESRKT